MSIIAQDLHCRKAALVHPSWWNRGASLPKLEATYGLFCHQCGLVGAARQVQRGAGCLPVRTLARFIGPADNAAAAARRYSQEESTGSELFMSYPRGELTTPFARWLKDKLEPEGYSVWMDEEGIQGGVRKTHALARLRIAGPRRQCERGSARAARELWQQASGRQLGTNFL